jgi:hypothetical protein
MKIVTNDCYGGFSLSDEATKEYEKRTGKTEVYSRDIPRDDKTLVEIVEEWGERANGESAELSVKEIPDDVSWEIDEYDGIETIHEKHRSW